LTPFVKPSDRILHIGCGNSSLAFDLYSAGYQNITNIDFSETVIKHQRSADIDGRMEWIVADLTDLKEFDQDRFDVVIDKCVSDAVACGPEENVKQMGVELGRVLRTGGVWWIMSYSDCKRSWPQSPGELPWHWQPILRGKLACPVKQETATAYAYTPTIYHTILCLKKVN